MQGNGYGWRRRIILTLALDVVEIHGGVEVATALLAYVGKAPGEDVCSELPDSKLANRLASYAVGDFALPGLRDQPKLPESSLIHATAVIDNPERVARD